MWHSFLDANRQDFARTPKYDYTVLRTEKGISLNRWVSAIQIYHVVFQRIKNRKIRISCMTQMYKTFKNRNFVVLPSIPKFIKCHGKTCNNVLFWNEIVTSRVSIKHENTVDCWAVQVEHQWTRGLQNHSISNCVAFDWVDDQWPSS